MVEHYTGTISKFGVDIGYTEGGVLVWGVFAPTSDMRIPAPSKATMPAPRPRPLSASASAPMC